MKFFILLAVSTIIGIATNAQRTSFTGHQKTAKNTYSATPVMDKSNARTTATGDTIALSNVSVIDSPILYYAGNASDSGFLSGTDAFGDMGYAERYDFNGADSSLKVIGIMSLFGGWVNPATTKTVTFYTWTVGLQESAGFPNVYDSGFPDIALDSVTVPITHLGIGGGDTMPDTFKTFFFTSPTAWLTQSFFSGYTINYNFALLNGDTIGVYTSPDGDRTSPLYTISGADTIINNQSVTMFNDGYWYDNASDNFFLANNFYLFPIVVVKNTLSVKGITNSGLTFFGNYPNPATNSTNIKFSLSTNSDVTITITDLNGKSVNTIKAPGLNAGEHTIPVQTTGMKAGDYLYIIRTGNGQGIASKLTIVN